MGNNMEKETTLKTCPHCSKTFESTNLNNKYCSRECRYNFRDAKRPRTIVLLKCAECGKFFEPLIPIRNFEERYAN